MSSYFEVITTDGGIFGGYNNIKVEKNVGKIESGISTQADYILKNTVFFCQGTDNSSHFCTECGKSIQDECTCVWCEDCDHAVKSCICEKMHTLSATKTTTDITTHPSPITKYKKTVFGERNS